MVGSILPLRLVDAQVSRRGKTILGPVTFEIGGQGVTVVLGPNGSGKTTLLRAMHGLERVRRGRVEWACPEPQTRPHQGFVFQSPIIMRRSVLDNIAYPLRLSGVPRTEARERAAQIAEAVGIGPYTGLPAAVLSGGEKQKLAIARALVRRPQVLFLDEPCANLDGMATRDIESILATARDQGTRIVMSTHNVAQARRLADDVLFLYRGLLHDSGRSPEFFDAPATPEAQAFINGDLLA